MTNQALKCPHPNGCYQEAITLIDGVLWCLDHAHEAMARRNGHIITEHHSFMMHQGGTWYPILRPHRWECICGESQEYWKHYAEHNRQRGAKDHILEHAYPNGSK